MFEKKDEEEFFKKIGGYWLSTEGVPPAAVAGNADNNTNGTLESEADDVP